MTRDMEKHITVVAALQIGFSILGIIIGSVIFIVLTSIGVFVEDETAFLVLSIVGTFLGFFLLILSIPGIIGGVGLLKHKNWARILVIILSVLDLINFPIGTAIGVYSIWALAQPETKDLMT